MSTGSEFQTEGAATLKPVFFIIYRKIWQVNCCNRDSQLSALYGCGDETGSLNKQNLVDWLCIACSSSKMWKPVFALLFLSNVLFIFLQFSSVQSSSNVVRRCPLHVGFLWASLKRWLLSAAQNYCNLWTNDEVLQKVGGRQLPGMLVKRKLQYFGHLMRKTEDNLEKDIITGSIPGNRRRGRPNKVLQMVWDREYWRDIVHRAAKVHNDE